MSRTYHFLDFDLLEGNKLACPGLHHQATNNLVPPTGIGRALLQREERPGVDLLETFLSARFARVRINENVRFHVGHSSGDSSDGDELSELSSSDFSYGLWIPVGFREGLDVELAKENIG